MGSNPVRASEFFLGFICNCLSYFILTKITFTCTIHCFTNVARIHNRKEFCNYIWAENVSYLNNAYSVIFQPEKLLPQTGIFPASIYISDYTGAYQQY